MILSPCMVVFRPPVPIRIFCISSHRNSSHNTSHRIAISTIHRESRYHTFECKKTLSMMALREVAMLATTGENAAEGVETSLMLVRHPVFSQFFCRTTSSCSCSDKPHVRRRVLVSRAFQEYSAVSLRVGRFCTHPRTSHVSSRNLD